MKAFFFSFLSTEKEEHCALGATEPAPSHPMQGSTQGQGDGLGGHHRWEVPACPLGSGVRQRRDLFADAGDCHNMTV